MRKTFDIELTNLARNDENIYLLVCDLGSFPCFRKEFPERFINCGIQETNMVSVAVGLATQGKKVYIYGVAGFVLFRAHEQLKYNVGYWNLPITLVNGGAGLVYNQVGKGHYIVEDIALVRTFPNFTFCMPKDIKDFKSILQESFEAKNPYFIRLGRDGCSDISEEDLNPKGTLGVIYTTNTCLTEVIKANNILKEQGLSYRIKCMTKLDRSYMDDEYRYNIVIEDHILSGGLGSFIREQGKKLFRHIHLPMIVEETSESYEEILRYYGLDHKSIADEILNYLDIL